MYRMFDAGKKPFGREAWEYSAESAIAAAIGPMEMDEHWQFIAIRL